MIERAFAVAIQAWLTWSCLVVTQATSVREDEEALRQHGAEPPHPAESAPTWTAWKHRQLALQYRLARKRLLQQVIEDMEGQALMVSDAIT